MEIVICLLLLKFYHNNLWHNKIFFDSFSSPHHNFQVSASSFFITDIYPDKIDRKYFRIIAFALSIDLKARLV